MLHWKALTCRSRISGWQGSLETPFPRLFPRGLGASLRRSTAFFGLFAPARTAPTATLARPARNLDTHQDIWLLTVTTGVVLQGFGRLVLARAYLRVEHILNSIQARTTEEDTECEGSFVGDDVHGSGQTGVESEGGRKLLLKLNGVSSSLGEVLKLALRWCWAMF